ncbi:MAG: hypothetical protein JKX73_06260 [Flavobacteriales bacterium]|nr:hypothetical protein [Flavobacteriales bacterium]
MDLYTYDSTIPQLLVLIFWLTCALIQSGLEVAWLKTPTQQHLSKVISFFAYFVELPLVIIMTFYLVGNLQWTNFIFPTYVIMTICYCSVIGFSLYGITQIYKRKRSFTEGPFELVNTYSKLIRVSFLIAISSAILAVVAKLHIENVW